MKHLAALAASTFLAGAAWFAQHAPAADSPAAVSEGVVVRGTIHSITLPEGETELPQGPGREATQAYCVVCHTTAYIFNQPRLSRETWVAEVTKMRKSYSAPVPEEKVNDIVDYLTAVRGPENK